MSKFVQTFSMDNGVNGMFIIEKLVYKFIEHAIKNESMKR
jgi:hypothetical protein